MNNKELSKVECDECDGTGKIWFSCCGDELNEGDFEADSIGLLRVSSWNNIIDPNTQKQ